MKRKAYGRDAGLTLRMFLTTGLLGLVYVTFAVLLFSFLNVGLVPLVLIVVGFLLWLVNRIIPMQGTIKSILNAVVIICVAVWLLNVFGILHSISRIRVGH